SEGWRIAGRWKHLVILSPPDGNFLRVVDLRNDIETLRPNAPGDEATQSRYPNTGEANWENVDEETPDEWDTYNYASSDDTWCRDLYSLPTSAIPPEHTISSVKIIWRAKRSTNVGYGKPSLRSNSTTTDGTQVTLTGGWVTYSQQWNNNPADGQPWELADINALQIGTNLYRVGETIYYEPADTQLYVEITHSAVVAPTVTTPAVSDIGTTTATGNGNITDNGGENCSKRGVCWNTTGNPTVADSKSEETDSFGTGAFARPMTGLTPGQHYYVKAYAYNSAGYGYGSQVEFTTKETKTKTCTLAARLRKTREEAYSLAGRLFKTQTKDYTATAKLIKRIPKTYTLAARLLKLQTKPYTLTGKLVRPYTKECSLTAKIVKRQTKEYSLAARLFKTQTKDYTLAARLLKTQGKTYSLAGRLLKTRTQAYTLAAQLIERLTKDYTLAARLKKTQTKAYTLASRLLKTCTKGYTLAARLTKLAQTKTYTLAARPTDWGYGAEKSAATLLYKTKTYSLAGRLLKTQTMAYTLGARLRKTQEKAYSLAARLFSTLTKEYSLSAKLV
ncbi:unnamed protein product, partial [marine sediment metagenome]